MWIFVHRAVHLAVPTLARVTRRKQAPKDLTGIRQRGSTYQVRISGLDPVTGRQLFLAGSTDGDRAP